MRNFLLRFNTGCNIRIEKQVSDNSDKLDQIKLSLDRAGSSRSGVPSTDTRSRTKKYLLNQLDTFAKSLENTAGPPSEPMPAPVYPNQLASNTHRPDFSETGNDLGQAIATTQRIIETYTRASACDSAHSLDDLSIALMDVGLADEASQMSSLSVRIYGTVPALKWDSNFAVALRNYSNHLHALGQDEEGVKHAEHAVDIYFHHTDPAFDPGCAAALDSLAACLYGLDRSEKALEVSNAAVAISRDLLRQKPADRGLSGDLAMFLVTRANAHRALNHHKAALEDAAESRNRYQALKHLSDRYTPEYADALGLHSVILFTLRQYDPALDSAREAVALWVQLDQLNPDVYGPKLARGLVYLFDVLNVLGLRLAAEREIRKAVDLFRRLAAQSPADFNPEYARSLHATAQVLMDQERPAEALHFLEEAASIYAFAPSPATLASVYNHKHLCYTRLGDFARAVTASREAVAILKRAPQSENDERLTNSRRDLASALYNRSVELQGEPAAAAEPGLESVGRFRALLAKAPDDNGLWRKFVAATLSLSYCYSDLKRHPDAVRYGEFAVLAGHYLQDKKILKRAWTRLSYCYRDAGDETRAVKAKGQASTYE
ncbi:hypothetical protein C8R46DRAFT_89534 [Mycena filopes]|nr:hypothetical protein C8R46DRAFT_89534 [Mycena filopes]